MFIEINGSYININYITTTAPLGDMTKIFVDASNKYFVVPTSEFTKNILPYLPMARAKKNG